MSMKNPDLVGPDARCLGCGRRLYTNKDKATRHAERCATEYGRDHYVQVCPYGNGYHVSSTPRAHPNMNPNTIAQRAKRLRHSLKLTPPTPTSNRTETS